jgi:peroxiredoxin
MKHVILIGLLLTLGGIGKPMAQERGATLPENLVNVKGKAGTTIFENATGDTLKIKGMFFNWLPYTEHGFNLVIPPGKKDSLVFKFNYPDFITINNNFQIWNGPGKRVVCVVRDLSMKLPDVEFNGDFNLENTYYLSYDNFLGKPDNESRPYYNAGDKLADFNKFPAMADSITKLRLTFLNNYQQPLSPWFKKHEYQRLLYNGNMRKYNVLFDKEFRTGKPLLINSDYYSFEKQLKLVNRDMLLNTSYLWATDFYLDRQAKKVSKKVPDAMLYVIDSLAKNTAEGDVLKMRRLGVIYTSSKAKYDSVRKLVHFLNYGNGIFNHETLQAQLGQPKLGAKAPDITLPDINGKQVSVSDYKGHHIIINFWAMWCAPCIAEFANENKMYQQYKNRGLVIINICISSDTEHWRTLSKKHNLQMVNLYADAERYKAIKAKFNISAIPRAIAIDKDFKVYDNYFQRVGLLTINDIAVFLNK